MGLARLACGLSGVGQNNSRINRLGKYMVLTHEDCGLNGPTCRPRSVYPALDIMVEWERGMWAVFGQEIHWRRNGHVYISTLYWLCFIEYNGWMDPFKGGVMGSYKGKRKIYQGGIKGK